MSIRSYYHRQSKKNHWNHHSYHSLHMVMLFFFILAFGLLFTISSSLHTQTIQQHATPPKSISSLFVLVPKKSVHHPLHIHRINTGVSPALTTQGFGLTPQQIHAIYNIPLSGNTNGTIAIVDAYTAPSLASDLNAFDSAFNLSTCTTTNSCLTIKTQSSTPPSNPPSGTNWDIETTIDVEWAHATAPNAKILLYQANSDQPQDLLTGVDYARNQSAVSAISMSWITPEFSSETQLESLFTSTHPVAFFAASGDTGTGTNWPAASANVTAIGGTTVTVNSAHAVTAETAWSGSGGGQSQYITEPSYQSVLPVPNAGGHRAIPDVSLNADPNSSPYVVVIHGSLGSVGGTSVGTPIWAGMSVLGTTPVTNSMLYQHASHYSSYYRDIIQGTNGTCGYICTAHIGYDFITGLGSPIVLPDSNGLISPTLSPTSTVTPTATITSTPSPTIQPSGLPTPTIIPGDTSFGFSFCLHGIFNCGDNVNAQSGGNHTPLHPQRNITITVLDANNNQVMSKQGIANYNNTEGYFYAYIDLGHLASGQYLVTLKTDGYLQKQVAGIQTVTQGQQTILTPGTHLITGDINNDDQIDLLDYNLLIACFGSQQHTSSCTTPPTTQSPGADITDDGVVDGVDYNLFLRELSVQRGG